MKKEQPRPSWSADERMVVDLDRARAFGEIDKMLARGNDGAPIGNVSNLVIILSKDPTTANLLGFNEFTGQPVIKAAPPPLMDDTESSVGPFPRPWSPADVTHVQSYVQRVWLKRATKQDTEDAMIAVCGTARFHPVRDWLLSLRWDGIPRLKVWLINAFDAPNDAYHNAVGAKFMIAAVRRVMHPGCKFDHMPVFEGKQAIGKSTAVRALFGAEWTTDSLPSALESRDAALGLSGAWCVEFAEIEQIIRTEVEVIKAFLSRPVDRFRAPYGRTFLSFPRQCVLVGTTNDSEYLRDATGNRRFWPVQCETADVRWIVVNRDQLWAEAVQREASGEDIWLSETSVKDAATQVQAGRMQEDVWEDRVMQFIENRSIVTVSEILTDSIHLPIERQTKREQMRVSSILRGAGWLRKLRRDGDRVFKRWERNHEQPPLSEGGNGVVTP